MSQFFQFFIYITRDIHYGCQYKKYKCYKKDKDGCIIRIYYCDIINIIIICVNDNGAYGIWGSIIYSSSNSPPPATLNNL